jgi:hypothetical protein
MTFSKRQITFLNVKLLFEHNMDWQDLPKLATRPLRGSYMIRENGSCTFTTGAGA